VKASFPLTLTVLRDASPSRLLRPATSRSGVAGMFTDVSEGVISGSVGALAAVASIPGSGGACTWAGAPPSPGSRRSLLPG